MTAPVTLESVLAGPRYLTARQVWTRLGIGKTTFYSLAFFRTRKHWPSVGCARYLVTDVELYERIMQDKAA